MPGRDGTGPLGQGPMTGRGMGYCVLRMADGSVFPSALGQDFPGPGIKEAGPLGEVPKEVIIMPAGDGTGPRGQGPMTGRGAGFCAGYSVPGYMNPVAGRGIGVRSFAGAYGPSPYVQAMMPYGYGAGYAPGFGRPFGRFGLGFGRSVGRGFGRGRGRGRRFGW